MVPSKGAAGTTIVAAGDVQNDLDGARVGGADAEHIRGHRTASVRLPRRP